MEPQVAKLPPQLGVGAAIAGLAFTALLFSALTMTANGPCGGFCLARISDESVVDFYADSGHRWIVGTAYVLALMAGFSLLWFLTGLRLYVQDLEGTDGSLTTAAFGGGLVYIALLGIGVAVFGAAITGPGLVMTETYYRMNAQDVWLAGDIMIMARSAVGSATMALATSVALLRARRLRALGWIGVVLGVLMLLFGIQEGLVDRGIGVRILGSDLGVVWTAILCITALIGRLSLGMPPLDIGLIRKYPMNYFGWISVWKSSRARRSASGFSWRARKPALQSRPATRQPRTHQRNLAAVWPMVGWLLAAMWLAVAESFSHSRGVTRRPSWV